MPELPEVEAARSAIAAHCLGKTIIKAIIANDDKVIHGVSFSQFQSSILNKTIVAAHRKGKNMWLQLDSPPFPTFQFGMSGAIYIKGVAVTKYKRSAVNDTDEWPSKFSKFFIELNDGLELSFTDKRRFAKVRLLDDPRSVPPVSELGPDALLEPMTEEEFFNSLSKKKIAIKALLLDQSFISGVGNWVADEVLYQAKIHPSVSASSLSREDSARLQKFIKEVIESAVEVGADSSKYPSNWIYHSREKKPEKAFVDGRKIDFITVGGRTTAYVPEIQKLSGEGAKKATSKPRKQASKKKTDDQDDDVGEPDSEEERKNQKSKQVKNIMGGEKKPPGRKKITESDADNVEQEKVTTRSRGTEARAKKNSRAMEDDKDATKNKKSRGEKKKATKEDNPSNDDGGQEKPTKVKGQATEMKMRTRSKAK